MKKEVTVSQPGGIGLPGALFITFLVLKLTGVIGWGWEWVFAPIWIPAAFWLALFILVALVVTGVKAAKR